MKDEEIKKAVRNAYRRRIKERGLCSEASDEYAQSLSKRIGYTQEEIEAVPVGSNLGLGCGNPVALASLKAGETVLDLGSGAGFDCFLAAKRVGENGKVIGVDLTKEMIKQARENAKKGKFRNVEFRHGEVEKLPVGDESVDIIISNCVINLSSDKKKVFKEAFRTLKPSGRMMISDLVLLKELPEFIKTSIEAYAECLGGAVLKEQYLSAVEEAGFRDIKVVEETRYPAEFIDFEDPAIEAFLSEMKISEKQAKEIAKQFIDVVSIRVSASKA